MSYRDLRYSGQLWCAFEMIKEKPDDTEEVRETKRDLVFNFKLQFIIYILIRSGAFAYGKTSPSSSTAQKRNSTRNELVCLTPFYLRHGRFVQIGRNLTKPESSAGK